MLFFYFKYLLFPRRVLLIQLECFEWFYLLENPACQRLHRNSSCGLWSVAISFVHCGTIKANPAYTQAHVCTLLCMHNYYLDTSDKRTHHLPLWSSNISAIREELHLKSMHPSKDNHDSNILSDVFEWTLLLWNETLVMSITSPLVISYK